MGLCMTKSRNKSDDEKVLTIEFNGITQRLRTLPMDISILRSKILTVFQDLKDNNFNILHAGTLIETSYDIQLVYSENTNIRLKVSKKCLEEVDLSGHSFWITRHGKSHMGFVIHNNCILTTADILPTPESVYECRSDYELDPSFFFYSSPTLKFSIVALKNPGLSEPYPISMCPIPKNAEVYLGQKPVTIERVSQNLITYHGDAFPGTPVFYEECVVGMHLMHKKALNMPAIINELNSIPTTEVFYKQINQVTTKLLANDPNKSPTCNSAADMVFFPKKQGILGFNPKKNIISIQEYPVNAKAALVHIRGAIYISGGKDGDLPTNSLNFVNFDEGEMISKPDMKTSRHSHAAIILNSKIYVLGGAVELGITNTCERFDLKKDEWSEVYSMNEARKEHSAAAYKDKIYVAGGVNEGDNFIGSVERYDGINGWITLPVNLSSFDRTIRLVSNNIGLLICEKKLWKLEEDEASEFADGLDNFPARQAYGFMNTVILYLGKNVIVRGNITEEQVSWKQVSV